jgi:hypothetical protein
MRDWFVVVEDEDVPGVGWRMQPSGKVVARVWEAVTVVTRISQLLTCKCGDVPVTKPFAVRETQDPFKP